MDGASTAKIDTHRAINWIAFTEDCRHILTGGPDDFIREWNIEDGKEVGERMDGIGVTVLALSKDRKWIVTSDWQSNGAAVWDRASRQKVLTASNSSSSDARGTVTLLGVEMSPDSTKFAFASGSKDETISASFRSSRTTCQRLRETISIWDIKTGQRLQVIGPLRYDTTGNFALMRFSPGGDRLAVATQGTRHNDITPLFTFDMLRHITNTAWLSPPRISIYSTSTGHRVLDIPLTDSFLPTAFVWSSDDQKIFAMSAESNTIKCMDPSDGSILSEWKLHTQVSKFSEASIVLASNDKFIVSSTVTPTDHAISFWDTSTQSQIVSLLNPDYKPSRPYPMSLALSDDDTHLAMSDGTTKITIRNLKATLPWHYFEVMSTSQLPLVDIGQAALSTWEQDDLRRTQATLSEEIKRSSSASHHLFANRALIGARMKCWSAAYDDAINSIGIQPSPIGYIAKAYALVGKGDLDAAMRAFDLVFTDCDPKDNTYMLLIKSILLFVAGKCEDALSRVEDLINTEHEKNSYYIAQAEMYTLKGNTYLEKRDFDRAAESFQRALKLIPSPLNLDARLHVISLIFGWSFSGIEIAVQQGLCEALYGTGRTEAATEAFLKMEDSTGRGKSAASSDWMADFKQKCVAKLEISGDDAANSADHEAAIARYSAALSLKPANPTSLLQKRCNGLLANSSWEAALRGADEIIHLDPSSPCGYEVRHAALHGAQRFDEAIEAFRTMLATIRDSPDKDTHELLKNYVTQDETIRAIDACIRDVFQLCPLVLIDVTTGRLCDGPERIRILKSEQPYKELVSSITTELDHAHIRQTVAAYFRYFMFSHVWQGREPTFQDVSSAKSVWDLEPLPLNQKVQNFCGIVQRIGGRWCWSDTCCIDKTISSVLNQSITSMYRWYEFAAVTLVFLADVTSSSKPGDLRSSLWMTRAWTGQELLASKVVRFYDKEWNPYLNDTRENHKESPMIMEELAGAIDIAAGTIATFTPRDLGVRAKLRLASMRKATVEEDIAYSLIGIFESDIMPRYGEGGEVALGHLLEEIVSRSGEVTVLAWVGTSSGYNSALPSTLAVYSQKPHIPPAIEDGAMELQAAQVRRTLLYRESMTIYDRITRLPSARFANRRLHLPCIVFPIQNLDGIKANVYRASVSVLGDVTITTAQSLSQQQQHNLFLVHPWMRNVLDKSHSLDGLGLDKDILDENPETSLQPPSTINSTSANSFDTYTLALRLIVRLGQPFSALLLERRSHREFARVAVDQEIIVQIPSITSSKDIKAAVLEIL